MSFLRKAGQSMVELLKMLWDTGTVDRWPGSGRPHSARTEENVETVNGLVLSHENNTLQIQIFK